MERICPFLATSDDGRAVVDGYDRAHVCRADGGRQPVDRSRQVGYCLSDSHRGCERYVEALARRGPVSWPDPSPDAAIRQTRLVLQPAAARRTLPVAGLSPRSRRWLVGGAVATIGVAAVASGVVGSLGAVVGSGSPAATATPSPSTGSSSAPVAAASATPTPTALPTPTPTPAPTASAVDTPTPEPTATPAPQPQTYIVQPGDTLNGIAIRFGTTVEAIQEANGLGASDVILVGQVLIIP